MEGLASVIHQGLIKIPYHLTTLIGELESFEFEVRSSVDGRIQGVRYSAPPGMYDDCVVALALAVEQLRVRPTPPVCMVGSVTMDADDDDDEHDDGWVDW